MADLTKAELTAKLEEANANLAKALETIEKLNSAVNTLTSAKTEITPTVVTPSYSSMNSDVTVVWMVDQLGYMKGNSFEYYFNTLGEEIVVPRYVFDEMVGKYRNWFLDGRIAVSHKNVDIASVKKLKTDLEYNISSGKVEKMGSMTEMELKEFWNSLKTTTEKTTAVTLFKRGIIEDKPGYKDISKISILNGLTNGAFTREIAELGGVVKYQPVDLNQ